MSDQTPLFTHSFLMSCWVQDYEAYCASDADEALLTKLKNWSDKDFQKETRSEAKFLQLFFEELWGYVASGSGEQTAGYTIEQQFPIERAGQNGGVGKADAAMGWFGNSELPDTPQILCEFKDIRSGLDAKQNRKGNDRSPVKQCADYLSFSKQQFTPYGSEKIQPSWGIVSDMNEFRLYYKARMPQQYESFTIKRRRSQDQGTFLLDTSEKARQKRFLFSRLFHTDWLLNRNGKPQLLELYSAQGEQEKSLEKAFYFEYRAYRDELFTTLLAHNPSYQQQPRKLVRLTQKLLDRLLFVLFCEDMGAHLNYPVNLLRDLMSEYSQDERYSDDEADLWQEKLIRLFNSMRDGTTFLKHPINRFNGGLFAVDSDLDALHVPNKVFFKPFQGANTESLLEHKRTLLYFAANYNFGIEEGGERAIGLYTLGRIFEQSITDLEIMEAEAANEQSLMKLSKRKTNGVYYTPEWTTAYIVDQSLGVRLEEIKAELGIQAFQALDEEHIASDHTKPKSKSDTGSLKRNTETLRYFELLETYHESLGKLKILDPACGSGAFLIQALKYLLREHEWISSEKARVNYKFRQAEVFDKAKVYREILAKNLYGVDINTESVEITKLALWLHTVMPGKPLSSLDNNILCGNSLVDDQIIDVIGELSDDQRERINPFNYRESFADVFAAGGFDVIIGNPPYIKLQNMRRVQLEATDFWSNAKKADGTPRFRSAQTGNYDIYLPFTEQCIELLHPQGRMGFIQPNVWAVNDYGRGFRELLHETRRMDRWIDFKSYQIFDEAITYTALQFFTGQAVDGIKLHFAPKGGDDLANLDWEQIEVLPYEKLPNSSAWQFMPKSERLLLEKLSSTCKRFDDPSITSAIFQGFKTSGDDLYIADNLNRNDEFIFNVSKSKALEEDTLICNIEEEIMFSVISGDEANRYENPQTEKSILVPYFVQKGIARPLNKTELQQQFPMTWSYLSLRSEEFKSRESGKMQNNDHWWGYIYPKNLKLMRKKKLLIAGTAPELRVSVDCDGEFTFMGGRVYGILPTEDTDLYYLSGLINSSLLSFIFALIARPKAGGYFDIETQFLAPLPMPLVSNDDKSSISKGAEKLQELHTSYRDELQKLTKRMSASQLTDDTKTEQWIWADLPTGWKATKTTETAKQTELKGAALTAWAKAHYKALLAEKLQNLSVRLNPALKLTVTNDDGELSLLADGAPAFDSIFVDEGEAEFIAAQWKYVIRTNNITPSMTAEKLLSRLLQLKQTDNDSLKKQIIALDTKLDQLSVEIEDQEHQMNTLVYQLYDLSPDEIRQVELG